MASIYNFGHCGYLQSPTMFGSWYGYKYHISESSDQCRNSSKIVDIEVLTRLNLASSVVFLFVFFCFSHFSPNVSHRKLQHLHSININLHIAVILSPSLSLYAFQKLRYKFPTYAPNIKYGRGHPRLAAQHAHLSYLSYQ